MLNTSTGVLVGLVTETLNSGVVVPDTPTLVTVPPPPPPVPGPITDQVFVAEQYIYWLVVKSQIVGICLPVVAGAQAGKGSVDVLMSVVFPEPPCP